MEEIKVLLLGLGQGGTRFLKILGKKSNLKLMAVEKNPDALGVKIAKDLNIPVFLTLEEGLEKAPNLIIDTTGDPQVEKTLKNLKENIPYLSGYIAKLFISLADELFYQEQELEAIINSAHDGLIAVNREGIITWFNNAAEKITGINRHQVLGKYVVEAIPNTRLHIILKTGKAEINQFQDLGRAKIITSRIPLINEFGDVIGAFAIFKDITDMQKLAEELTNLQEIKTLLTSIIDCTQDAISVVDEQGYGLLINKAYTELTGLTEKDVIGKPATVDIAEGESVHFRVLQEKRPIKNIPMKVGPLKKEVVVNAAPLIVDGTLKGSVAVIHDVSELKRLTEEIDRLKRSLSSSARYTFDDIVGEHPLLIEALELAKLAAQTSATVLLRGESGTGKELFAHAIHNHSPRAKKPFIRINCAALTESLLESELFGYEEGAFTGAKKGGKKGVFEEANGGTLFLDEITTLSPNLQAKLLRVLQEKEIVRVGGNQPVPVDVRIIAATNLNLEEAVKNKTFREDLYYRINVIPINLPALRERKTDIPALARAIVQKLNREYGRNIKFIDPEVFPYLMSYSWPGNIRELENYLGRAMLKVSLAEDRLGPEHLPKLFEETHQTSFSKTQSSELNLKKLTREFEKSVVKEALERAKYNKTRAAQLLGITPRSLYNKLKEFDLL
ncbi:sigma-54-dependent Fis family transcriptional regulator [Carboxydothermus islandicus]|uniref:Sigma-54-dependent Fis family transcriptional regulator n=1 Tax=Carboxydothermus islandicus TaxID=661089 RepID=A0A1L8CZU5_9THEO|nr:sigma-54-dependent Fis family transcriptional regulator [Carboxydothermus islandicus]GAV24414.1 sigma-54-dependent Fis family transcriptional regulator [Carboxydothermus islandicus]